VGKVVALSARCISGRAGSFSQVYADVTPKPEAIVTARIVWTCAYSLRD
jgi:hypothetical protein